VRMSRGAAAEPNRTVNDRSKVKQMKASTKSEAESKLREVEGALKEAVAEAAKNRDLQAEGKREKRVGSRHLAAKMPSSSSASKA
jgi:uncharacterized protein YjbJ (UPF0337 family)